MMKPPLIQSVASAFTTRGLEVSAVISAPVDTLSVVMVTHTSGDGRWQSTGLSPGQSANGWRGLLPATTTEYVVQAADLVGNVAMTPIYEPQTAVHLVYLPQITR